MGPDDFNWMWDPDRDLQYLEKLPVLEKIGGDWQSPEIGRLEAPTMGPPKDSAGAVRGLTSPRVA